MFVSVISDVAVREMSRDSSSNRHAIENMNAVTATRVAIVNTSL